MEFNSTLFIAAFTIFLIIYSIAGTKASARTWLLLIFNLTFYYLLSGPGIYVLLVLGICDFWIARGIHTSNKDGLRRFLLYLSLFLNVGLILTFRHFTDWFDLNDYNDWPRVIGVSFFVFRSMGYVLDVYRETIEIPESGLHRYLTWLSFFPLILAGPISPAREFLPELKKPYAGDAVPLSNALFLLISGIIKKFILSNYLAINFVDRVFESPSYFTGLENTMAVIGQALVVYLDFSGYTDLMLGIALLLGFQIRENFNFPYLAGNITEYWRRWHMSLSAWLNEYLFFPMSFALRRLKKTGTVFAVLVTFAISGFWHGTAVQYTVWGLLHGVALSWDVLSGGMRDKMKRIIHSGIYRPLSILFTFAFLCLSGIFFKTPSMEYGYVMFGKIFGHLDISFFPRWLNFYPWIFAIITGVLLWQWSTEKMYVRLIPRVYTFSPILLAFVLVFVIFLAYQITGLQALPFIYLEF